MSHSVGQTKEDDHQSNSNSNQSQSDSLPTEVSSLKPTNLLSDADYEFLFNQLLEGIAHGWHERRINKFFRQLGERGEQEGWVAWLERVQLKLLKLPLESKRQVGTLMIRMGELTRSVENVRQIGAASQRVGKELLFGSTAAVIWEYVGPDLASSEVLGVETERELAERLPTDFEDLQVEIEASQNAASIADHFEAESLSKPSQETKPKPDASESQNEDSVTSLLEDIGLLQAESPVIEREPRITDHNNETESISSESSQLADAIDAFEASRASQPETVTDQSSELPASESEELITAAIDVNQVMHLIQEDQELAQQISQKLNDSPKQSGDLEKLVNMTTVQDLDDSSLELVESWFNLGLKQVSAGEFSKAIASWEKALKINPNLSEAWHNRGSALGRLGEYEAAVDSFQSALTIDPHNYQAWNDRAHALYQLQNWIEAASSWSNAIKIMPGNHLFWYNRGCALEQLEKWQEAIASYEKALEIKPDFQPGRARYINLVADNSRAN